MNASSNEFCFCHGGDCWQNKKIAADSPTPWGEFEAVGALRIMGARPKRAHFNAKDFYALQALLVA